MSQKNKIPFSKHKRVTKNEIIIYLEMLVETYRTITKTDIHEHYDKFPLWKIPMRVVAGITKSYVYFFITEDAAADDIQIDIYNGESHPELMKVMDALSEKTQEVASILEISTAIFTRVSPAIEGYFSDEKSREDSLNIVKEHYEVLSSSQEIKSRKIQEIRHEPAEIKSNKIFIVHGHDGEMRESMARTLDTLGLDPIILDEQKGVGSPVIQKMLDNADVSYAVVLISPDDKGEKKDESFENFKFRARQNVIFELGFFIGKLGPENVFPLFRKVDNYEMLSDYVGVVYVPYDKAGKWKFDLVRELQSKGYEVDANALIR